MISRRWFMGMLGAATAAPVAAKLLPAATAPPQLYGRGPMLNAVPMLRADFNRRLAAVRRARRNWKLDFDDTYYFVARPNGSAG